MHLYLKRHPRNLHPRVTTRLNRRAEKTRTEYDHKRKPARRLTHPPVEPQSAAILQATRMPLDDARPAPGTTAKTDNSLHPSFSGTSIFWLTWFYHFCETRRHGSSAWVFTAYSRNKYCCDRPLSCIHLGIRWDRRFDLA